MASGSVFSETLQTITTTKLEELAKQRVAFEKGYVALLTAVKAEQDPLKRLLLLVDGTKSCLKVKTSSRKTKDGRAGRVVSGGTGNARLEVDLRNLDRFLEQARFDPSVSEKVLQDYEKTMMQYLSVQSSKYQYADLYGKLVTEWLSSEKSVPAVGDIKMAESFEEIPSAKKLASRAEWEKNVFEPAAVDVPALKEYLKQLFIVDAKEGLSAINDLRKKVEEFEASLSGAAQLTVHTLRWVIQGLQASDLLPNEKREVLKDFLGNDVILAEIGDVLSMRLSAVDRWSWGSHVPLEQRRLVNGTFSIHMHEDVLQAIFLHYIGVKWSVFFKTAFLALRKQSLWRSGITQVSNEDLKRRDYFLGYEGTQTHNSLDKKRDRTHRGQYFVHQLMDYDTQQVEVEEGEEEAEFEDYGSAPVKKRKFERRTTQSARKSVPRMQLASKAARKSAPVYDAKSYEEDEEADEDDEDDEDQGPKRPMEAKQDLLHLLATEIIVNTKLHTELSCFRTVFSAWNSLLPHETALSVLQFFGVSDTWSNFFSRFLQAPLQFIDDGPSAETRIRRRGTPGSHALSDVFGETVLFCLDFSVNQVTEGAVLHRLFDDVWFWNKDYEKCVTAWSTVDQFAETMGVYLNDKKTGSVRISPNKELTLDERLPAGQIRWGFLFLDPTDGRFAIDQKMVDDHVGELRNQLQGKSKSVIDWIQAWNSYAATFLSSNFGKASNCFGREHVDRMLATHRHVQESIFEGGNVVQYLKKMIADRFKVHDVPDGFLLFPVELGGLELKSPFVGLLQTRESVLENPYELMDELRKNEVDDYNTAKTAFDNGAVQKHRGLSIEDPKYTPSDPDRFFDFDEYTRFREAFYKQGKANLPHTYSELLRRPEEEPIDVSVQVSQALDQLQGQSNLRGINSHWYSMDAYWKWVAQMYGPEMLEKFGGMNVVDPGLLPIGMVGFFRQRRTKWQS